MRIPLADTESPPAAPTALLVDVALQVGTYLVLRYLVGTGQMLALVAATTLMAARIAVRSVVRRSADPLEWFTLALLGCSIIAAVLAGRPRVILLTQTASGLLVLVAILAGLVLRRPAVATVVMRLAVRGDGARAHLWNQEVRHRPATIRAMSGVDPLWLVAVAASTTTSIVAALTLSIDLAVVACQAIQLVVVAIILPITWLLLQPVRAVLSTAAGTPPTYAERTNPS